MSNACLLGTAAAIIPVAVAVADTRPAFVMEPLPSAGVAPQIIGGWPADPDEWRASLKFTYDGKLCTSAMVGPRVIVTAAHCVPNQAAGIVRLGNDDIAVVCTQHPEYVRFNDDADFALCLAESPIPARGVRFEVIAVNKNVAVKGDPIILTGFGCTNKNLRTIGKAYYLGNAKIYETPGQGFSYYAKGEAHVCFGDSGGPAFRQVSPLRRRLIAVNSSLLAANLSQLTAIPSPPVVAFITNWKGKHGVTICGIDGGSTTCAD